MSNNRERLAYLDEISGLLILVMVIIHICSRFELECTNHWLMTFYFFMPWFYFKSGVFHKDSSFSECYHKNFDKLMKPYFIYSVIGTILVVLLTGNIRMILSEIKEIVMCGSAIGNIPVWFLLSLFIVKLLSNRVTTPARGSKILLISLIASTLVLYIPIQKPNWIGYTATGMFFYVSGFIYRQFVSSRTVAISSIVLVLSNYVLYPSFVHIRSSRLECGNSLLWLTSSVAACILIYSLFKHKKFNIPFLGWVGRHAMTILVTHWLILNIIKYIACDGLW